ncbi:MAG TPA: hypothetical protein VNN10_06620 [Dehalococcoidia bacterium]|nr:hypothetical protein [Dehalococcoidia bacterium]
MADDSLTPRQTEEERAITESPAGRTVPADYGGEAAAAVARTGREMSSFIGHFSEVARAEAAVGPAQSLGGHTLVPLAAVSVQGGFGMGFGGGGGTDEKQNQGGGSGGGAGGGGRGSARVIAIADVSESGVVVRPVPDVTMLALGLMALIGLRMISGRGARGRLMRMLPSP